jgi:hypothetical protein
MSLWMLIVLLLGLIKLPIAALMLWLPFRNDEALRASDEAASSDEDGGSAVLPAGPLDPHPGPPDPGLPRRRPPGHGGSPRQRMRRRRGAHGPTPASPARVRAPARQPRLPLAR